MTDRQLYEVVLAALDALRTTRDAGTALSLLSRAEPAVLNAMRAHSPDCPQCGCGPVSTKRECEVCGLRVHQLVGE